MIKIELDENDYYYSYGAGRRTHKTIKQILLAKGYSETDIKKLRKAEQVLISPGTLTAKVKKGQTLYILSEPEPVKDKVVKSKRRFDNIGE